MKLVQGDFRKTREYVYTALKGHYFEFYFPYIDEDAVFREINRFNDESKKLTRFKNKYTGNVVVNLTAWIDKPLNEYFTVFMYFLVDRTLEFKNSKLIFTSEKVCSHEFLTTIEDYFDNKIQVIDLGVKTKDTKKTSIGFITDDDRSEKWEDRNV